MNLAVVCYDLSSSKAPSVRAKAIVESIAKYGHIEKLEVITSEKEELNLNILDDKTIKIYKILNLKNPINFIVALIKMRRILKSVSVVHVPINFFQALLVRMIYNGPITLDVGIQQPRFWRNLTKYLIKPEIIIKPTRRSAKTWKLTGINSIHVLPPRNWDIFRPYSKEKIEELKRAEGIPVDKKVVLFVGRLTEFKGADIFYKLAKRIKERRDDLVFLVVGDGPLRYLFENDRDFIFKGYIPNDELPKYYNIADVTIVLGKTGMNGGNVAIESAACGTPVINTTKGRIEIYDLIKVYIWVDRNIDSILESLETLIDNRNLYKKKVIKGIEIIRKNFPSYREFCEQYLNIFQAIIKEKG